MGWAVHGRGAMTRSTDWMFSEALEALARAERLHRQMFRLERAGGREPAWEPPVDMIETERELLVIIALPGVDPDKVEAVIEGNGLTVSGKRILPPELRTGVIHRLELPQGRFQRTIPLPAGRYASLRRSAAKGCVG